MNIADFFGGLMSLCFVLSYIPQLVKIVRTKQAKDISPAMYIVTAIGYVSGFIYVFLGEFQVWLVINFSISLVLCLATLWSYFIFRGNKSE